MERLITWLQTHRWRAFTGALALMSGYLLVAEAMPQATSAYARFSDWRGQQARITSAGRGGGEQARLDARKRQLRQRFADLYVGLPGGGQMSAILQALQEGAEAEKVILQKIQPGRRTAYAYYDALPFEVELRGTFHAIGLFIHRMEHAAYVIKVMHLSCRRVSPASTVLQADVSLRVIILKEREGDR